MRQEDQLTLLQRAVAPFVADVRRTLDPTFEVEIYLDDDDDLWMWRTYNTAGGICSTDLDVSDAAPDAFAELVAQLAEGIPDFAFDDVLTPWPRCPHHQDHPLYPGVRDRVAVWMCRRDRRAICDVGHYSG